MDRWRGCQVRRQMKGISGKGADERDIKEGGRMNGTSMMGEYEGDGK